MDDVYSYLKWRGDLSLAESPFNEIDSLILTLFAYVKFEDIVPGLASEDYITLKEASESYSSRYAPTDNSDGIAFMMKPPMLLKAAAATTRYGDFKIGKHVNQIDTQMKEQFSATTFQLSDGSTYIAYRGTDTTIVGWKEDFNMSFLTEVPAQADASKYLEIVAKWSKKIRIGGHSKGGNLAIYSGIKCTDSMRAYILSVHNFDGPGFLAEVVNSEGAAKIQSCVTNYLPKASVIGMLLEHVGENKIVNSNRLGIVQHDSFTWEVGVGYFPTLEELNKSSLMLDSVIKQWIYQLDKKEREQFVDALFGLLEDAGIERVSIYPKVTKARTKDFLNRINSLPTESKRMLAKTIRMFFSESRKTIQMDLMKVFSDSPSNSDQ